MSDAKFVWWDLNSKDAAAAEKFYSALFGWKVTGWRPDGAPADMPEYRLIAVGEQGLGGINALPADSPAPSHWMGHVEVDDVDAAMERAKGMGAQFPHGANDIPTVGRMAVMIDPQGCVSSLFTPAGESPQVPTADVHGAVGWNELMAADADAAKAFYSEVVGWTWRLAPMEGPDYHLFGTGEDKGDAGGMIQKTESMPVAGWLLYFTTNDIDRTVKQVPELGGKVFMEPFAVPGVGRLAVCSSPDGAMFGVAQWEPME